MFTFVPVKRTGIISCLCKANPTAGLFRAKATPATTGTFRAMAALALVALMLTLSSCAPAGVQQYKLEIVNEYPHDTEAYTQGLFFQDGKLQESTGVYGHSSFRKNVNLESGSCERKLDFESKYFIEGSCVLDGELFILTWREAVVFVYDAATLEFKRAHRYPRQGWGLTTDGKQLIASDGSSRLYFFDKQFKLLRKIEVTMDEKPVLYLNELEWIDGKIWANVYQEDHIVIIDPENGKVEGIVDCRGLLPRSLRTRDTDVLNGIACDGQRIFLTGKYWPRLYEIKLLEKK